MNFNPEINRHIESLRAQQAKQRIQADGQAQAAASFMVRQRELLRASMPDVRELGRVAMGCSSLPYNTLLIETVLRQNHPFTRRRHSEVVRSYNGWSITSREVATPGASSPAWRGSESGSDDLYDTSASFDVMVDRSGRVVLAEGRTKYVRQEAYRQAGFRKAVPFSLIRQHVETDFAGHNNLSPNPLPFDENLPDVALKNIDFSVLDQGIAEFVVAAGRR